MVSPYQIQQALAAWHATRMRMLQDDAEISGDESELGRIFAAETDDIDAILDGLLRAAVHADSMAEAAANRAADIKGRADRFKRRSMESRRTALAIMEIVGKKRHELPDVSATITQSRPSVIITDETKLADEYIRIKREPDKAAIMADLKVGVVVDGAELSNATASLTVRTR